MGEVYDGMGHRTLVEVFRSLAGPRGDFATYYLFSPLESGSKGTCNFEVGLFMGLGVA